MSTFEGIVKQLEAQKAAIERALEALREVGGESAAPTANRRGLAAKVETEIGGEASAPRRGGMSPEGKARLVAALKKRWAAKKAAAAQGAPAVAAKKATRKGGMTAEGRQRLAEAMKKRWAVKRSAAQAKKAAKKVTKKAA